MHICVLPGTRYMIPGTKYLVPGMHVYIPGTWHLDPTLGLEADPRPGGRPSAWRPTPGLEADHRPGTRP